jgi:hypothetical protein
MTSRCVAEKNTISQPIFNASSTSQIVIVKQLRRTDNATKLAHLEMKVWRQANGHDNVVRLLGKRLDAGGFPSMVAEYCEQGDLLSVCVCFFGGIDLGSEYS